MKVWKSTDWKEYYSNKNTKNGIRLHFDKEVDPDLRTAIIRMVSWLRKQYIFPVRFNMYIKETDGVVDTDGDLVSDFFAWQFNRDDIPYAKIGVADYRSYWLKELEKNDAIATILEPILKNITHYFQWINGAEYDVEKLQRQAKYAAKKIMDVYCSTRENP